MGGYAWVTLATNDAYCLGVLVLAHSLRRVDTKHDLVCLITPGVTAKMRETLAEVFSLVQEVNVLDSKDEEKLALLARPELGITFTKLHCWRLTQYEKCVFVDADTLVVRNCDELFEREELSAAPDVGWPDCFNSGVFVFRPSQQTFASLTAFAAAKGSFDGGDQGLLNMYFSDWATKDISKHLPFIYNMCSTATYSYLPAFKQFGEDVRIIHFIGITKPWLQYFDTLTGVVYPPPESSHLQPLLQLWFNIFYEKVHPHLSSSMATSTLAPNWHSHTPPSYVPPVPEYSVYSGASDARARTPDFSEFRDPWEDYSPRSESAPVGNSAPELEHARQPHDEQQQSSHTHIVQTYEQHHAQHEQTQHQAHGAPHFEGGHNRDHHTQYTHHWQQINEPRHDNEHRQHNDYKHHDEQRHYHEQRPERRENKHHHGEQTRHNGHQHLAQPRQHESHVQTSEYHVHQPVREHYHAGDGANHTAHQSQAVSPSSQAASDESQHARPRNETRSERSGQPANKQTDTRRIESHFLPPTPCTDLHNVATQSDPNVVEHLDSANTGIAGALAQMTLGQPRSAEQVAYEEHMRKQSWEQGQIDYMGRDSFDNIWKKICETLSFAPQRQPTPPKEDTAKDIAEESDAAEPAVKTPTPVEEDANKPAVEADKAPTRSLAREEIPEEKAPATQATPPAAGEAEEPAVLTTREPSEPTPAAATEDVPAKPAEGPEDAETGSTPAPAPSPAETIAEQCRLAGPAQEATLQDEGLLETGESRPGDLRADATCEKATPEAEPETASPREATQPADAPQAVATSLAKKEEPEDGASGATADVTQPLTIDPSEQHAEVLLAASEVSTVSPVPIQVAEAVLQAEPKESVAGAAAAASGQAIAATVTAVHRPADVAPLETTGRAQVNGSACESERRGDVAVPPEKDLPAVADVPNDVGEKSARAPAPEAPPAAEKKVESSGGATPPRESPAEAKSPERETVASAEETEALLEQLEKTESSDASEIPESPVAEPSPPAAKTTLSVVPSTPTVTEPTPPASPCAETAPETADEKAAKRDLRKSESADGADSEGADKKTAKKTVKKVTKKPKAKPDEATSSASDGAAAATADSSPGKTKRTVKVTKKTSTKTPEAGATPETPPPSPAGGPDVPVPPKRKTKSGAPSGSKGTEGKVAGKKADAEE